MEAITTTTTTTLGICDLPSEIIAIIVDLLGNKDYLVHFKETCCLFNKSVSHFYIAGQMVSAVEYVHMPMSEPPKYVALRILSP